MTGFAGGMGWLPWGDLTKGVDGELEIEPIFDDLLVHLIGLAIANKSQKESIGKKSLALNTRIMLLFSILLCAAEVCSPHFHLQRMKMRAVLNNVIYFKFIFLFFFPFALEIQFGFACGRN